VPIPDGRGLDVLRAKHLVKVFRDFIHILQCLVPYKYADSLPNHDQSNQLASSYDLIPRINQKDIAVPINQ
jgi:hypothetical protein